MKRTFFIPIAAFFLLSGCSSDDDAPIETNDPTLEITSNNAMQVGKIAYESALASQQLGDAGGNIPIGSAQGLVA